MFKEELIEGVIKSRPNRFIMLVDVNGHVFKCHCPATGRIGSICFENIPCLLSRSKSKGRKTNFTVEAFSLDPLRKRRKSWIGINQNAANRYVEFFLKDGQLPKIVKNGKKVKRERKLGNSRIDFSADNCFIEVKTPLIFIPCEGHSQYKKNPAKFDSFDRFVRHYNDLAGSILGKSRAVVLLCYFYDAEPFKPPAPDRHSVKIQNAAKNATLKGVENWQANFEIDKKGVSLIDYFKLKLF